MIEIKSITDLHNMIQNQVEENLHLDYKSAEALAKTDGKRKEIVKDVSAFANSDGGIIIYGIKEFNEQDKRHLPENLDPIDRNNFSKEWLEQVINGGISPRIENVKIFPIPVNATSNQVIYVVEIPKSNTAHQASDFRYYKRYNFESSAMYDFEVRDIMNRKKAPLMQLSFEIVQDTFELVPAFPNFPILPFEKVPEKVYKTKNDLKITIQNVGGVYAQYVNCYFEIPEVMLDTKEYDHLSIHLINSIEYKRVYLDNTIREVYDTTKVINKTYYKYWPSRYEPILPCTKMRLEKIQLRKNIKDLDGIIYWSVNADNAEQINGEINLREIEKIIKRKAPQEDE